MTATCLLLHGSYGTPYENWIPSVSTKLSEAGILNVTPGLPTPGFQNFDSWAAILDAYVSSGFLSSESAVIAHSSSASFVVRYLAARKLSIRLFVSIAGFSGFISGNESFDEINSAVGVVDESDFEKTASSVAHRLAFISDNDPNLPLDVLRRFATLLKAETELVPGAGHFNAAAGYLQFPELVQRVTKQLL